MSIKKYNLCLAIALLVFISACNDEWLEIKQNKKQVVPTTLADLQALLDNTKVMNIRCPFLPIVSANEFYIEQQWWERAIIIAQNAYIWKKEMYEGEMVHDWEWGYERVFYANTALDGLSEIPESQEKAFVKGRALFYRAWSYYKMAQLFCKPYDSSTSEADLGLPLRKEADITIPVVRSSVKETYDFILSDLLTAIALLPEQPSVNTRPAKAAAHALLAKNYLIMGNYQDALSHVEQAIMLHPYLLDFNDVDPDASYALQNNDEIIFHAQITGGFPAADYPMIFINQDLFNAYEENDLRKSIYFRTDDGSRGFNGSYSGRFYFSGIASDELYLIQAECHARLNNIDQAMASLNFLLQHRFDNETFTPISALSQSDALKSILEERHKELLFRGTRWTDLRRLNKEPEYATTLTRELDGQLYELPPNDPRYVMQIPDIVLELSGIQPNNR